MKQDTAERAFIQTALRLTWALVVPVLVFACWPASAAGARSNVIQLTQVPCQFLEAEAKDHNFKSDGREDCVDINAKTAGERLSSSKTMVLEPGKYVFRVTNKNVPYELGFYLRPKNFVDRLTLPKVSGGGLKTGSSRDYHINLVEGEYLYSCPLNPTPDYRLTVKSKNGD